MLYIYIVYVYVYVCILMYYIIKVKKLYVSLFDKQDCTTWQLRGFAQHPRTLYLELETTAAIGHNLIHNLPMWMWCLFAQCMLIDVDCWHMLAKCDLSTFNNCLCCSAEISWTDIGAPSARNPAVWRQAPWQNLPKPLVPRFNHPGIGLKGTFTRTLLWLGAKQHGFQHHFP